jgi:hypothetical protein
MKVLDAQIEWMWEYSNSPSIKVLVDKIPNSSEFVYEQRDSCYFGENGGLVSYYSYRGPDNGYGGRHFKLKMKDGTEKTLIGPWSSRSSVMNGHGFPLSKEVTITDSPDVWKRGHTFYGAAVTFDVFKQAMAFCPEADFVRVYEKDYNPNTKQHEQSDWFGYEIIFRGLTPDQTKAWKRASYGLKVINELYLELDKPPTFYGCDRVKSLDGWVEEYNKQVKSNDLEQFGLKLLT